jgi:hypothetical protein
MFPNLQMLLMVGGISLVFGLGTGYHFGSERYVKFQSKTEAIGKVQEEKVNQEEKQSNEVSKVISSDYNSKLRSLQLNASSGKMSDLSNSPVRADEGSAYAELVEKCSETTIQLVSLQEWVKEQALVYGK